MLVSAGAYRTAPESGGQVLVRMLATPERIKRELAQEPLLIGLLRALWRAAGASIERGAVVDLDVLPPGFGGASGGLPLLDELQQRQFVEWRFAEGGARLTDPTRPLAAFKIDWPTLDRRRRAELSKLDTMQQYAYTRGCRRAFVLRYFGDPSARTSCSGCDVCLGTHRPAAAREHDPSPAPRTRRTRSAAPAGARGGATDEAATLDAADERLLARLRALRSELARSEGVPAYVVFPDRTLAEIAVRKPRSAHALAEIRGVGPTKLERYGPRFLEVVRAADETEAA